MGLLNWLRERTGKKPVSTSTLQEKALPVQHAPSKVALTPNEQVAADYIRCFNAHREITQLVDLNGDITFKEAPMTFKGFQEEMARIYESLPDFKLNVVGPIKEQPDGRVMATLYATGTHTGKPYSFGPFPPIEPKGKAIKLDSEKCFYTIRDGKIGRINVIPLGESTGPPGVYTQLGGLIF